MKKFVAVLSILLIAFSLLSFDAFADNDSVVFVNGTGGGNGSSASSPISSLATAFSAVADGGTIVICGEKTILSDYNAPLTSGKVKVTSVYGGVDYRKTANASLVFKGSLYLNGDTTFENLNIKVQTSNKVIACNSNKVVFGDGIVCTMADGVLPLSIVGGAFSTTTTRSDDSKSTDVTVNSGKWRVLRGGNRSVSSNDINGNVSININGGTFTSYVVGGSASDIIGDINITINGGVFEQLISASYKNSEALGTVYGNVKLTINGGTFSNTINTACTSSDNVIVGSAAIIITGGDIQNVTEISGKGCVYGSSLDISEYKSKDSISDIIVNYDLVFDGDEGLCDIDADGRIAGSDIAVLIRYLGGWYKWSDIPSVGDANKDGKINNRDAVALVQILSGWRNTAIRINSIKDLNLSSSKDSHADSYQYSSLEMNYRESSILGDADLCGFSYAMYPRIKKISENKYFLVCQSGQYGGNILFATSTDGINFSSPKIILSDEKILNGTDTRRYMTADAAVLSNGDILLVASFRAVNGYRTMVGENGLVSMRSSDGGKTWSEKSVIYVGTNWEPYVLALSSGEIQVYFTATAEKIYLYGYSDERISSGIGMIRSTDNGYTWTPDVKGAPYAPQYVMKQYVTTRSDGVKCFTDQMASAVVLNNGTIALVGESRFPGTGSSDVYKISVGISKDNWATWIGFDEAGPAIRSSNMFLGAGPYISQFASGETLLTYNRGTTFYTRLGSADALSYADVMKVFEVGGFWGSCLMDSSHSAILTSPSVTSSDTSGINAARFYLNHDIKAQSLTPTLDGGNEEWSGGTDALFIGSESQAQTSFRFSYDDEYIYVLAERLDRALYSGDSISLMFADDTAKGFYNVKCDPMGVFTLDYFDGTTRTSKSTDGIEAAVWVDGTLGVANDTDTGIIYEIKIPRKYVLVKDGIIAFNALVYNKDTENEKATSDTFSLVDSTNKTTWQRIIIK